MKASVKFRDDQKPLFRAKVPLNILGMPFQSGIVAGESKELTLNLGTFFASGPSIRIAYRPNDKWNPFSFIVKTGTGPFGSPTSSSMLMSAEFNLLGRGNPSFMLHFKPQFGDYSVKKSQSSSLDMLVRSHNGVVPDSDASAEAAETPMANGAFAGKKISVLPTESPTTGAIAALFAGTEVAARTALPVIGRAVLNFRWGVRVPSELDSVTSKKIPKIPMLVMNKIGIEHVDAEDSKPKAAAAGPHPALTFPGNAEVAEACFAMKRLVEGLQDDNRMLRKAVDDLRREMTGVKSMSSPARNSSRNSKTDFNGFPTKSTEVADVSDEFKKPLK